MSGNVHEATLVERRTLALAIDELVFTVPDDFRFRAGQFVSIRVGLDADGSAILRSYSIAGGDTGRFSLVVKCLSGGVASAYLAALTVGDTVRLTGPMGFFVLELAHAGDVVFGATGVGIAPVRPMLEEVLARKEKGRVHLFWGSRHKSELFWLEELQRLQRNERLSVHLYLSAPGEAQEPIAAGRISEALVATAAETVTPTFYLVGSGAMIRDVKAALVAAGYDRKRQIRNEAFFD